MLHHILCIGVSTPLKNTTPFSLLRPPLNLQTVQALFVSPNPPLKFYFSVNPHIKIFMLNPQGLPYWVDGGKFPPTSQKFAHSPPPPDLEKSPSPPPPPNKSFQVITQ